VAELRLVGIQTRFQLTGIARNRRAVVLSVFFPIVLLVMFNSIFVSGSDTVELDGARVPGHAYVTGAMLAYAILLSGFTQLGIALVNQRESGQLKRLRGTPVPAWTFIVATALRAVAMVGLMAVVLLLIGGLAYNVSVSAEALVETVLYVVLGTATMVCLAVASTTIAADVDSASAALPLTAVVLALISGIFVPVDQLPSWLEDIGKVFPVYHLAAGLQTALGETGATFHASDIVVLCIWALGGIVFAARRFRWEPGVVGGAA
jgi:ABC-2 type transport system permease protein